MPECTQIAFCDGILPRKAICVHSGWLRVRLPDGMRRRLVRAGGYAELVRHAIRVGSFMKVDPEQLRALAASLDGGSSAIDAIEVRPACDAVAAAMPGTELGQAAAQAGELVEGAYLRMSWRLDEISRIARGNANSYDVEEGEFSERLGAMGHAT